MPPKKKQQKFESFDVFGAPLCESDWVWVVVNCVLIGAGKVHEEGVVIGGTLIDNPYIKLFPAIIPPEELIRYHCDTVREG